MTFRLTKVSYWLVAVLITVFLLRLPSFFEPHWYGDEEIYLVLGQMLKRGAILYRDIWDNKTPLLYFLYAVSPTLVWAKLTATVFVLGTTLGVYKLAQRIFEDRPAVYSLLTTALVGVLLSLPALEGNIANAELYFTLPIIFGAMLVYRLLSTDYRLQTSIWVGLLAALAFLLKVPAVLDFIGILLAYVVIKLADQYWLPTRNFRQFLAYQLKLFLPILISFSLPIAIAFLYFFLNRALSDFLVAAFSQNASYVAIWSGPFSRLSNPLFIKGIALLLGVCALALGYFRRLISKELLFLTTWLGFGLYGALLSNRLYPHYLLQIVSPLVFLVLYTLAHYRRYYLFGIPMALAVLLVTKPFWGQTYAAKSLLARYQNFFDYISERESWEDYVNHFDSRTLSYYTTANIIRENTKANDPIFVWGDVAAIYDLADRPAATKFIAAHHLTTIDPDNYNLIMQRLIKYQPKYIVVTRPVQFPFPALEQFLQKNYRRVAITRELYLYRGKFLASPPAWDPKT